MGSRITKVTSGILTAEAPAGKGKRTMFGWYNRVQASERQRYYSRRGVRMFGGLRCDCL
jgi:hypothetical protein